MGIWRYAIKRIFLLIPVLLGVSIGVFFLIKLSPGSVIDAVLPQTARTPENIARVREELKLNEPLYVQYFSWLFDAIQGDLGRSYVRNTEVFDIVVERAWPTAQLAMIAFIVAVFIAIPSGVLSAVYKDTWVDHLSRVVAFAGLSIPAFWLGIMIIFVFGLLWGRWFGQGLIPIGGYVSPTDNFVGWLHAVIAPGITLGVGYSAITARLTRSTMVDVLNEDYILSARAKGVKEFGVVLFHAFRNAMIPIVTILGLHIGFLFGGSVVVEEVFQWPGVGRLLFQAVLQNDLPIVQGILMLVATIFVTANLIVDLLYAYLDPRIKYD